jgi:predicted phage terminase large subunit-like protein
MDLALSVGKGDFSVVVVAGVNDKADLYILDVWRKQVAVDDVATKLTMICQDHNPREVLLDNDNASRVFKTYAMDSFRRSGVYAPLNEMPTLGQDKETRSASFRGFARQGRIKLVKADWNAALLDEVMGFPDSCPNDDQIDCLSLLGRRLARMSPGEAPEVIKPPEKIVGGITVNEDGLMVTTASFDELWEESDERINLSGYRHRI